MKTQFTIEERKQIDEIAFEVRELISDRYSGEIMDIALNSLGLTEYPDDDPHETVHDRWSEVMDAILKKAAE